MIKKAKFLAKEGILRIKYMTSKNCIFCKIVKGEIKNEKIVDDDLVLAFDDVNPVAETHVLIIPKKHVDSVLAVGAGDGDMLVAMNQAVAKIVSDRKLSAFRLAFNGGKFQHVPHLHMHLLAGSKIVFKKL